jgi:hypothetical protein
VKSETKTQTITKYRSEVLPEVATEDPELGRVIAWADENPQVWSAVTKNKSKAFGRNSCEHIGWAQKCDAPEAILERARRLCGTAWPDVHADFLAHGGPSIFSWRGRFTVAHYKDKGFTGGFFQKFDGAFDRDCMSLDYTPATLPQVLRNFMEWAGGRPEDRWKLEKDFIAEKTVLAALKLKPDWEV